MRQTQQEADENLRHELDQELDSIRSLLYAPGPSDNTKSRSHGKNLVDGSTDVIQTTAFDQEYDQFVRELASDKRAQPKDRTKTEEELALEEKEALEKAEKRRIRRMNGEDEESGSEDEKGRQRGGRRKQGGDDLEDDFVEDDSWGELGTGLGSNNAALSSSGESEGTSDDGEEDSEDGGDGTGEEADDDIESSEDEAGGEVGDSEDLVQVAAKSKAKTRRQESHELPYTFPCPTNHDEFLEIVESVPDSDIPTVVKRIRALHHPSLATENKFKLQVSVNYPFRSHFLPF